MADDRNLEVVRRWGEAAGRGELAEELWHPDLEIVNAQGWVIEATYRGPEGLARWWRDLEEAFSDFALQVDDVEPLGDGRFLTSQRFVGRFRTTGIPIDAPWASVITVRDGLIAHAVGYFSRKRALRAIEDEGASPEGS